jgi:hypothetical protein
MIITRQKNVPWSWVVMTHLPYAAMLFASAVNTVVFTLEIRKFTANPTSISLLLSLMGICWLVVNPSIHFISDRIWTRWGRRKCFYVPAILCQVLLIPFIPFAPNLPVLLCMFVTNVLLSIVSQPKESLAQEVIPNHMRGRGAIVQTVFVQSGLLAYNIALIGRFDDVMLTNPLSGLLGALRSEYVMFWVCSAALLAVVLIVGLGIKEMKPAVFTSLREDLGGKITLWRFIKRLFIDCFSGAWWPIYLLAFSRALYTLNLGAMVVLMYTDQWGYSTQAMGTNQAIIQLITVLSLGFLIPVIDKFDRLKTFRFIIILGMSLKIVWYLTVMLICPDNRPALWQILVIGESISIVGALVGAVTGPLVYEFVPVDKLGTANAGLGMFGGLLGMILGPMMGLWITYYSTVFYPAAGSNVSTVLEQNMTPKQAKELTVRWHEETGETYHAKLITPFGMQAKEGRQWDFRQIDKSAEKVKKDISHLESKINVLQREIDDAVLKKQDDIRIIKQTERAGLVAEVKNLEATLAGKAAAFRTYLETALGDRLTDGSEAVTGATLEKNQFSLDLSIMYPLDEKTINRINRELNLKLEQSWENVTVSTSGSNSKILLKVSATLKPNGSEKTEITPVVMNAVRSYFSRTPDLPVSDGQIKRFGELAQSAVAVLAGYRNFATLPFPDQRYKPQTYDYFSAYILMIITDFIALYILWLMARLEKKGKITRLGALEDQAARAKG